MGVPLSLRKGLPSVREASRWERCPETLSRSTRPAYLPEPETDEETDCERQGRETSDDDTDQAADANHDVQHRRRLRPEAAAGA